MQDLEDLNLARKYDYFLKNMGGRNFNWHARNAQHLKIGSEIGEFVTRLLLEVFVYKPHGTLFFLVYYLGIYLRCCDVFVTQQGCNGIKTGSKGQFQRGEGVTATMHNLSKSNGKWIWEEWTASGWEWAIFHNSANCLQSKAEQDIELFQLPNR